MKNQDTPFISAREKIKKYIKIYNLPIGEYCKRKLGRYGTALGKDQPLTPVEVDELDTALKTVQDEVQEMRDQLKKTEE